MKPLRRAVEDFLRDGPVCRIATVLSNGSPHVSRVCPVFDGKTMFIDLTHAVGTANALKADRRVTVLIAAWVPYVRQVLDVAMEARPNGINPDAVLSGRIGAHQFYATHDPGETTRNARAAFLHRFERERFSVVRVIEDYRVSVRRKPCPGKRECVYRGVTPN